MQEYGCVDANRIRAKLWSGPDPGRTLFRRIGILKKLQLIENVRGDHGVYLGYRISRLGQRLLENRGLKIERAYSRKQYRSEFEHDQLLIDVRRILEKSSVIKDFKTDQQLRSELLSGLNQPIDWSKTPTIPDGSFIYEVPNQRLRIAVELELSLKSQARYFRIFRSHLLSRNWQMVFYIVRDESMKKKVMEILERAKAEDRHLSIAKKLNGVYFCSVAEFLEKELAAQFTNGTNSISVATLELRAKKSEQQNDTTVP